VYVKDAVRGYMTLAEQIDAPGVQGEAFNFGTDRPTSVLEVIDNIIKLSQHSELTPVILNEVKHEIQDQYLSSRKARQCLGWQPRYTLEEGLRETMAWYRTAVGKEK